MKKILAEPLFHFLFIGALLFGLSAVLQDSGGTSRDKIVISENDKIALQENFARTWQRKPTEQELEGLVENKIRDEIAYREALALGLDQDDAYIRQRLRMKMELLLEDINSRNLPTDKELEEFLEQNREKFRQEAQISFSQVYLDVNKHKISLKQDIERLLKQLTETGPVIDLEAYGDPTMLPKTLPLTPVNVIDRQFGSGFSNHLDTADIGIWQGPIQSGYGYHLVLVHKYSASSVPKLSEVRPLVEREFLAKRRTETKDATYAKLREKYEIVTETVEIPNS